ncbi:diacylglycerol kinase family protein [Pedobacter metabolipauper]|uniref:Undecaprenol kinase/diacylglycerol kinase (ATP) n=1 Tax=Pedobacter metabolipauper TaxID=425513 RepID=A0A4R6SVB7_9SPHI|nr:diacylglycerol kinase family protein [Pedobacter metabolipauper]TDQ07707.1 undecaprenol kinase/diacylglycerol kinase (ATP) [Pedobacter metabolipauper]
MRKFLKSFGYAFSGVSYAFRTQLNFKVHTVALILACLLGWYLNLSLNEWLWITAAAGLVFIAELFNTALEVLVDLVSPSYNEKAKVIKDMAAATVLLAAILAVIIGLAIFIPKLLNYAA